MMASLSIENENIIRDIRSLFREKKENQITLQLKIKEIFLE